MPAVYPTGVDPTSSQQAGAFIELLKSISSASVGPNGAEVTLDRRGGRRLAKKISADNG